MSKLVLWKNAMLINKTIGTHDAIVQDIYGILHQLVPKQEELFSRVRDLYITNPVPSTKEGMSNIFIFRGDYSTAAQTIQCAYTIRDGGRGDRKR